MQPDIIEIFFLNILENYFVWAAPGRHTLHWYIYGELYIYVLHTHTRFVETNRYWNIFYMCDDDGAIYRKVSLHSQQQQLGSSRVFAIFSFGIFYVYVEIIRICWHNVKTFYMVMWNTCWIYIKLNFFFAALFSFFFFFFFVDKFNISNFVWRTNFAYNNNIIWVYIYKKKKKSSILPWCRSSIVLDRRICGRAHKNWSICKRKKKQLLTKVN